MPVASKKRCVSLFTIAWNALQFSFLSATVCKFIPRKKLSAMLVHLMHLPETSPSTQLKEQGLAHLLDWSDSVEL